MLFYLTCIYISFYYIRPFEWPGELYQSPIFFVLGVFCVIALSVASITGQIRIFRYKTDHMMLGYTLAIVLSHLSHGYFGGIIDSMKDFFPTLVCYFLVAHTINSKKDTDRFVFLLIALTVFLACEGILQAHTGFSHGGMAPHLNNSINAAGELTTTLRIRWFGPFNDPNDLGLALVIVFPLLVDMLYRKKWLVPMVSLPLLAYGVFLTNSRGAALALFATLFFYFTLRYRSVKGVGIGIAAGVLLFVFGPDRVAEISATEGSAYGRIEAWYEGFQMFKEYPLFGVGKGMFTDYHFRTAHNSFVLVLSELGLFGSFFFIALFLGPLLWTWDTLFQSNSPGTARLDDSERGQFCALISSLIGMLAAMFFLSRAYIMIPFMLTGLVLSALRTSNFVKQQGNVDPFKHCLQYNKVVLGLFLEVFLLVLAVKILI